MFAAFELLVFLEQTLEPDYFSDVYVHAQKIFG